MLSDNILHNHDIRYSHDICCENPRIIVNPKLPELLCKYHHYMLNGVECYYRYSYRGLSYFNNRPFTQYLPIINHENINNYYVYDASTGESFNIFLEVPCGHCGVCADNKANAFVARCRYESQMYDCQPYFFTLTYDNSHLPDTGVSVRDIQLFLKRFRQNLLRHGFQYPIRYCICSHYGPKTHRPHYHGIIWNLQPNVQCDLLRIKSIMQSSWNNGEIRRPRFVDVSTDRCFYYTTRYVFNTLCEVPRGCNSTFMLSSRRNGGIGSPFLESIKREFQRCLNPKFQFYDRFTGKQTPLVLSQYVLNKLVPSFSRSISSKFRTAVKDFMYLYKEVELRVPEYQFLFKKTYEDIKNHFSGAFYFGSFDLFEHIPTSLSDGQLFGRLNECIRTIRPYCDTPPDFEKAKKVDAMRQLFIGRLSLEPRTVDVVQRSHIAGNRAKRLISTSVL